MSDLIDPSQLGATDGRLRQLLEDRAKQARLEDARRRLASRSAVRPTDAAEAGILKFDARVEVVMTEDPNTVPPTPYLEVRVYSLMRPGAYKRALLSPTASVASVAIAAGAAAEALCEGFGDPFDPGACARKAEELLRSLR